MWSVWKRRLAFRLLGFKMMDTSIANGDWITHRGWRHGPVKVIDQNWALRAVAVQLGRGGGIVVWPMDSGSRKVAAPGAEVDDYGPGGSPLGGGL